MLRCGWRLKCSETCRAWEFDVTPTRTLIFPEHTGTVQVLLHAGRHQRCPVQHHKGGSHVGLSVSQAGRFPWAGSSTGWTTAITMVPRLELDAELISIDPSCTGVVGKGTRSDLGYRGLGQGRTTDRGPVRSGLRRRIRLRSSIRAAGDLRRAPERLALGPIPANEPPAAKNAAAAAGMAAAMLANAAGPNAATAEPAWRSRHRNAALLVQ